VGDVAGNRYQRVEVETVALLEREQVEMFLWVAIHQLQFPKPGWAGRIAGSWRWVEVDVLQGSESEAAGIPLGSRSLTLDVNS